MHFPFQAHFIKFGRKIETISFWSCIKIPITIIPSLANMQNHLQCRLVAPASSRMVKSSDRAVIFALKCFRFVLQGIIHQSCHQLTSLQTNSKGSNSLLQSMGGWENRLPFFLSQANRIQFRPETIHLISLFLRVYA